jgi:peptidoglycan/LPS O-acetylase OafA/YrhL
VPSPKGSPTPKAHRFVELDGYRGLSAAMIVLFHGWQQGRYPYTGSPFRTFMLGLPMAVSLFFALSGMVIFMPMIRGALSGKVQGSWPFMARRLYRILPVYFLIIIIVWCFRYNGTGSAWTDLLRHLTFTQAYSKNGIFYTDGPAWSLAAEMHYYILLALLGPPLARIAARRSTVAKRLATMSILPVALMIASLAYKYVVYYKMHVAFTSWFTYYNPLSRADSFAFGMLLALFVSVPGVYKPRRKTAIALTVAGFALAVPVSIYWVNRPLLHLFYYTMAGILAVLLLAGATFVAREQRLSKILRSRTLQFWATISLSMYLIHEPIMLTLAKFHVLYFLNVVSWPISVAALLASATIAGWFLYNWVEVPGMRMQKVIDGLRSRQRRPATRLAGPPPRWLPDLVLATADGVPVALRDLPRDRPVLMAFERDGGRRLAEQRFRLDSREADGFYVTSSANATDVPAGTTLLVDEEGHLSEALNGNAALIELTPAGLITAMHEVPEMEVAR